MSKLIGIWYVLSYKLETHYLGPLSLHNWLWGWVVVPLVLAVVGRCSWGCALSLSFVGVVLWGGGELAKRRRYLHFIPGSLEPGVASQPPIAVDEKVPVRVSGEFAVGDGKRLMLNEPAFYTFVRTREHILMAHLKRTRFLFLAQSRSVEVGWWYVFFKPERLVKVQMGYIAGGMRTYPGVELTWQPEKSETTEAVYVGCDDLDTLARILDDLRCDAPVQAFEAEKGYLKNAET